MKSFLLLLATLMTAMALQTGRGTATLMAFDNQMFQKRDQRGTWYSGEDLKNAACYGRNGLSPYSATIHSMIGAMVRAFFFSPPIFLTLSL